MTLTLTSLQTQDPEMDEDGFGTVDRYTGVAIKVGGRVNYAGIF
jgi:hypothetical protein